MYGRGHRIPGPIRLVMFLFLASIWAPMGLMFFSAGVNPFWGHPRDQVFGQHQQVEQAHRTRARPADLPGTANERRAKKQHHEHHADGAFYRDEHPELAEESDNSLWMWALVALGSLLTAMGAMAAAVWSFLYPEPPRDPEELLEEALRS